MDYSQLDMLMTVSKKGDASKDKKINSIIY